MSDNEVKRMVPISKIRKPKLKMTDFAGLWQCPYKNPPKDGDKIFALAINEDGVKDDEECKPFIGNFVVVYEKGEKPCCLYSYFFLDKNGEILESDEYESILTQNYSVILYIKEDEYWNSVEAMKQYGPDMKWVFVKEVDGESDALKEAARLESEDPEFYYRIWDCRE